MKIRKILTLLLAATGLCCFATEATADSSVYIAKYRDGKQCAVSLTFDDGLIEHYTLVFPKLKETGLKATFWVCGNIINSKEAASGKPRMSWDQMREMVAQGQEISSHGWAHMGMRGKTEQQVITELAKNDSALTAEFGKRPLTFCYPGNSKDEQAIALASKNRVGTRTFQKAIGGHRSHATYEGLNAWLKNLMKKGEWGVGMTHGITFGYDYFIEPNVLWSFIDNLKSKENIIWVDTFEAVAAYKQAYDATEIKVEKGEKQWTIIPSSKVDPELYAYSLTCIINPEGKKIKGISQAGKTLDIHEHNGIQMFDINPVAGPIKVSF